MRKFIINLIQSMILILRKFMKKLIKKFVKQQKKFMKKSVKKLKKSMKKNEIHILYAHLFFIFDVLIVVLISFII